MKSLAQIGPYQLYRIETGTFALDGGAMFGVVPKPLWEKRYPCDARNRIPLAARALLLLSPEKKILVDDGLGDVWEGKEVDIYAIEQQSHALLTSLAELSIKPEQITDVLLTHLHFDHAGGSTRKDPQSGQLVPTFANATYHVQEKNFLHAMNPTLRDRASYRKHDFEPLKKADQLKLYKSPAGFDHDVEIFPGIQPLVCNGHTPGLQMIKISDREKTVVYCADTIPTHAHLPVPWVMGYDLQPLVTVEEKTALLKNCQQKNWALFFEHDAQMGLAEIAFDEKGSPSVKR